MNSKWLRSYPNKKSRPSSCTATVPAPPFWFELRSGQKRPKNAGRNTGFALQAIWCVRKPKKQRYRRHKTGDCYPSNHEKTFFKIVTSEKRMVWLKKLLLEEPCFGCTIVWRSTHKFSGGSLFWQPAYHEKLATHMTQPQLLQNKVTSEGKFGNSNKNHHWTWQHIPPGEDRWRSQLPCVGLSWPLTSHQLFGVASHLLDAVM